MKLTTHYHQTKAIRPTLEESKKLFTVKYRKKKREKGEVSINVILQSYHKDKPIYKQRNYILYVKSSVFVFVSLQILESLGVENKKNYGI